MSLFGLNTSKPFVVITGHVPDEATLQLLKLERAELEAVFSTPVTFANQVDEGCAHWVVEIDPAAPEVSLAWSPDHQRLTSVVRAESEYDTSVNLLHSLAHSGSTSARDDLCDTNASAFERIHEEIANVYPSRELRGLDWGHITKRYAHITSLPHEEFAQNAQRWVAELGDAHTALHRTPRPRHHPPYAAKMTEAGAVLTHVPSTAAASLAGVGPGWTITVERPEEWLQTTGSTARQHARLAARRFLAMPDPTRTFSARSPQGERISWIEHAAPASDVQVDMGNGLLRITGFTDKTPGRVDDALGALQGLDHVTVDLRGNCGGSLVAATEIRRRFLRTETTIGSIRFTTGTGSLADHVTVHNTPSTNSWRGAVTFLTDAMTYSASEDMLWGLQGLDHVRIEGATTGGGSGRPHTRRITEGLTLTVSTALTYDRDGRCIEYHGISPDPLIA